MAFQQKQLVIIRSLADQQPPPIHLVVASASLRQQHQVNATHLADLGSFPLCFLPIDLFCVEFLTLPLLFFLCPFPKQLRASSKHRELQHLRAADPSLAEPFYNPTTITMPAKSRFTRLDAFTKTVEDARIRTTSGGIVTIVSLIVVLYLAWGEWADYRRTVIHPELVVDKGRGKQIQFRRVCPLPCLARSSNAKIDNL